MNNVALMQVSQGKSNLGSVKLDVFFWQWAHAIKMETQIAAKH